MDYPLLRGGEKAGTLRIEQQGLYTCMEISAGAREGLLRVWVQGRSRAGGQEGRRTENAREPPPTPIRPGGTSPPCP